MKREDIEKLLGEDKANYLLNHQSKTISKEQLHLPNKKFIDTIWKDSNRNIQTLRNLSLIAEHGRLGGTGYVSILPVDQGIEHSAGASFAPNVPMFDSENIIKLAIEGGCNK